MVAPARPRRRTSASQAGAAGIVLLGATGSIGTQCLDVLKRFPKKFRVVGLSVHRHWQQGFALARQTNAKVLCISDEAACDRAARKKPAGLKLLRGAAGLVELAAHREASTVVGAIVGAAGLPALLEALLSGKRVAVANKEPLVMAGELMTHAAAKGGGEIVPIDSEHCALHQCLRAGRHLGGVCALQALRKNGGHHGHADGTNGASEVRRLILTASGGPFRAVPRAKAYRAGVEVALRHPTWSMGAKITVDSATLMNKALEIIEAHYLFGVPYEAIEVWIHRQSIVHSMVEFRDGSLVAQLGLPDMRLPIQYALTYPDRLEGGLQMPTVGEMSALTFEAPDRKKFPSLDFAVRVGKKGGVLPTVLNAANEQAVELFLGGRIRLGGIFKLVGGTIAAAERSRTLTAPRKALKTHRDYEEALAALLHADRWAREKVIADWAQETGGPDR
ncbi:MAG TPA: 1-deoxy-D-xylulose-5-phosphate reductoisomerase [Planctomycetota bacterium]|nr:1-deoxy-D-xylulose-5-phosphate reductoisomerase [Planctomycetota bacterium]